MNAELTKQIKEINADSALNSSEKSKKIQELFNKSLNLSSLNINDKKEAVTECKHYKRECNIVAKCCGKVYGCRLCHDENENHKIDRYATEEIVCKKCETRQPVSNKCINCGIKFGKYFCGKCRLWNDNNEDEVFHCDDCKVCRRKTGRLNIVINVMHVLARVYNINVFLRYLHPNVLFVWKTFSIVGIR